MIISKIYSETNVWHSINPDICTGVRETKYRFLGIIIYTRRISYNNDINQMGCDIPKNDKPAGFVIPK